MTIAAIKNLLSTAIGYAYVQVDRPTELLQPVKAVVATAMPAPSQSVVDEIVKAIAAVAIAALSRWVVSWFDKKKKVEIVATVPIESKAILPVEKQPESLTINDNTDGSKEESPQK